MTSNVKSAWVLDIAIKVALIICLAVLAIGLIGGADPIVAMGRAAVAFVSFLVLGWAASMLWVTPEPAKAEADETESETGTEKQPIEDEVQLSTAVTSDTQPATEQASVENFAGPVSQPAIAMAVQD